MIEEDDYFNLLTNFTYSVTSAQLGTVNVNYKATQYGFDAVGNQTATIGPLDDVTASYYNGLGQDTADYRGQIITNASTAYTDLNNTPTWTFSNLLPNSSLQYDVYVYYSSPTALDVYENDYKITNGTFVQSSQNDSTAPTSLGAGWYFLGTVAVSPGSTSTLAVSYTDYSGTPPTAVCILQQTSATTYNLDGDETSVTTYVDSKSSDNRIASYGYDWQDQQTYAVEPDAANNVTYTMTGYDNLGEVTQTQQFSYQGSLTSQGVPSDLATSTAEPPMPLGNDILLTQSNSLYNALGQVYESYDYPVVNNSADTPEYTYTWYDLDGNQIKVQDPLGNTTFYAYDGLDQQITVTQPAVNGVSPITQTVYDGDGNVTATIDPLDRVTATSYDAAGRQVAGYQGQIITNTGSGYTPSPSPTWTLSNLSPSSVTPATALTYDIYVPAGTSGAYSITCATIDSSLDPTAPSLGAGWQLLKTVTLTPSWATSLSITYTSGAPTEVCLLQQTSATAYDSAGNVHSTTDALGNITVFGYDNLGQQTTVSQPTVNGGNPVTTTVYDPDGNVTATIHPLGRVSASTYDEFGNVIDGYQGQTMNVTGSGPWNFNNLSAGNALTGTPLKYDLYAYLSGGSVDTTPQDYTVGNVVPNGGEDLTAPSLGAGWQYIGTVTAQSVSTSTLAVDYWGSSSNGPSEIALLSSTSSTTYDLDNEVTATTDALGNVKATSYDALGRDAADYQGQAINGGSATFYNLSPNNSWSYDVYVYSTQPPATPTVSNFNLGASTRQRRGWAPTGMIAVA